MFLLLAFPEIKSPMYYFLIISRRLFPFFLVSLFLLFLNSTALAQQIAINEVMASNASTIADEDGDFEDWIELYNYGEEPINLEGFGLSDNYSNPFKWVLPNVTIEPGQYLLVWASGKDRRPVSGEYSPGLVREVYAGIPGVAVSDLTNHISYPDNPTNRNIISNLFEAPINVADYYGQRIHGLIKAPYTGQYRFWIASDDNGQLFLSTTSNPDNLVLIAEVPGWTNPREWGKYSQQHSELITLQAGAYYYIMALMKEHEGGDNLAVGWQLPDGALERPIAGQHIFRDKAELHTNFSISQEGEEIILTNPSGNIISEHLPTSIPTDISYGRAPDGAGEWFFFNEPTPGMPNETDTFSEVLAPPLFSLPGGFFSNEFDLTLSHPDEEVQIVYTLDGSVPDPNNLDGSTYLYKNNYPQNPGDPNGDFLTNSFQSFSYTGPIHIYDRTGEPDKLTQISTTWDNNPTYFPTNPVEKGIVVKAKAIKPGAIASKTVANSFFMNSLGRNQYTLPLISISLQEDSFFDYFTGIYVAGQIFDEWRAANPGSNADGGTPANYWLRGDFTESVAHFELFEPNESAASLSQEIGVRLHGGWSRSFPLKSLRLYARARYGESHFNYPFFPDNQYSSFRRLLLRNSGNDYWNTFFRDAAIQNIVSHLNFDTQNYQPSVVYLNGEYWGIHNIRERFDKYYLERVYGVDPENIDLLENNANADEGDANHYNSMLNFIQSNSLSNSSNYEYIKTQLDVSSFIDYQVANIFAANTDWPGNNIKYWRLRTNHYLPNAPLGHDGRWRWLLYDTDFGFGLVAAVNHNTLQFATDPNGPGWPNPSWSTFLIIKLLENESFKFDFINRFADLLNTAFLPARMVDIITGLKQVLEPEMPEQIQRWKSPGYGNIGGWNNQVNVMINFANNRPSIQRNHIRSFFGISNTLNVTLNVNDVEGGYIHINTIDVIPETPGVNENPYPWIGIYFNNIPIQIEAIAKPGYVFSHWEGAATGNNPLLNITPTGNISLTAYFTESEEPESLLIHYWHLNNLPDGTLISVQSDFSEVDGAQITYPGTGAGYMDRRTHREEDPVSNLNLLMGQEPNQGAVLRARNPSDTRSLIIETPTTGYKDIKLTFATTRTSNGATQQEIYYSTDGGDQWNFSGHSHALSILPNWELINIDLSDVEAVNNNADLQFKVVFTGNNANGTSGNNRFDNISVFGALSNTTSITPAYESYISIHPNPARDFFTLGIGNESNPKGMLRVYSIDGTLAMEVEITQSKTMVFIGTLKQGLYIVNFINEKGIATKRIVKI
jgi:uncharacterized repeat protein (TIGR02543 family)